MRAKRKRSSSVSRGKYVQWRRLRSCVPIRQLRFISTGKPPVCSTRQRSPLLPPPVNPCLSSFLPTRFTKRPPQDAHGGSKTIEFGATSPHSLLALVDRRNSVRLDRHQLHRPPDPFHPCALSEARLSLDQRGLRQHRDRLSNLLFHWTNRVRAVDGSRRHAARPDHQRHLVFDRLRLDLPGQWTFKLCFFSFSARSGRIRQLAWREQSRFRMVAKARARSCGCVVRQRLLRRRSGRALPDPASVLSLGMASCLCHSGTARILLAHRLAPDVPPASGSSAHQ